MDTLALAAGIDVVDAVAGGQALVEDVFATGLEMRPVVGMWSPTSRGVAANKNPEWKLIVGTGLTIRCDPNITKTSAVIDRLSLSLHDRYIPELTQVDPGKNRPGDAHQPVFPG